ncbi:MAG: phosphate transport system substrate-binding protein [Methanobacteriota archaeon]
MMVEKDRSGVRRRKVLKATGGIAGAGILTGCIGGGGNGDGSNGNDTTSGDDGNGEMSNDGGSGSGSMDTSQLTGDGSSTVYPISNSGARLWNGNPPASDEEYWGPDGYGIDTDMNLADYYASLYGFEPTDTRSEPPFRVSIALSHSGTGVTAVSEQRTDMGNSSAPVQDELPERDSYESFVDHVVGVDGQPVVVSREIYEAGVTSITIEELRQIYTQNPEITNWSQVGGPDKEIQVVGRAEGSGTDTAFRANVLGDPDAPMNQEMVRYGQNQQVQTTVGNSDAAISYMALAFVEQGGAVPSIALEIEGTTYELGGEGDTEPLGAEEYPLSRDLHMYTWEGTDMREAAFINMMLSEFGQENCVAANNYFKLPDSRIENQRSKLPEQV